MNHQIPFFSLERQWNNTKSKIKPAIDSVLDSQQYVGGPFVKEFEEKLAKFLKTNHAIGCNSGTDALWLAVRALDLAENDIVITTPFSFLASASEVVANRGHVVFVDIDPETFNISPENIEKWLNENATLKNNVAIHNKTGFPVKGIIAVNLFGQCADFDKISKIAKKWKLWTIEDCAQAIGSSLNGKMAGSLADISTLSFYPTKNLGACGDAGAVCSNDPKLAARLLQLRNHGRQSHYNYIELGINSRLDALQAAVLSQKLDFLNDFNNKRREIAKRYTQNLEAIKEIKLPKEILGHHTYHQFCIEVDKDKRNQLIQHLTENKIGSNIFYPQTFNDIKFLQTNPAIKNECPIAQELTTKILALPIWPELNNEEIDYICDCIKNFFKK
ncbi:TPA: transcriptional regulator [Candidatus Dependentiae bacterium]|nr:MAG: Pleiotropic regulatory protein [candidate division TM6 bacterium GW2011_GWE2_31_21]KKP54085.1 MAG: Pleiotropic regulatory protein [candidate division TM6 bacterium GW2011_GWF2_33_332]HBS48333.1 transcriptional regulator [Candidatus Dependentiae bacterium]HBZ72993.1 transcriptional regulator [Candidatus Dependentiae bacterium]